MPWEETRERLGKARSIGEQDDDLSVYVRVSDIRAALERIKELERLEVTDVAGWAARAEAAEAKMATMSKKLRKATDWGMVEEVANLLEVAAKGE